MHTNILLVSKITEWIYICSDQLKLWHSDAITLSREPNLNIILQSSWTECCRVWYTLKEPAASLFSVEQSLFYPEDKSSMFLQMLCSIYTSAVPHLRRPSWISLLWQSQTSELQIFHAWGKSHVNLKTDSHCDWDNEILSGKIRT
jgi:hypothetical protein